MTQAYLESNRGEPQAPEITRRSFGSLLVATGLACISGCASPLGRPQASTHSPAYESEQPSPGTIASPPSTSSKVLNATSGLPPNHFIDAGSSSKNRVALTFDDLSGEGGALYADAVMDLAARYGLQLTFFPIGSELDRHRKAGLGRVWQRSVDEGHTIGNHTQNHIIQPTHHTSFAALAPEKRATELQLAQDSLDKILGNSNYRMVFMRPPGGSGGYPSIPKEHGPVLDQMAELGYWMTMWTTDNNGATNPDKALQDELFYRKIMNHPAEKVKAGSIILIHPNNLTIAGLERLISTLQDERGFELVSVPNLFV